ncbi:GNAT family protein [Nocardioides nanhaiensis]|uniref:GNAT family N-acetyltransferase n=1 Tax=Nocardioides nanhaiensis TaxID=1476871 RepID=A0ABP8WCE4_9ACTN
MLEDWWPLFGLVLRTPRVELRLPREPEVVALAELAADGVHAPGERPFLTPWTEAGPLARAREVLGGHWERMADWQPEVWRLGLGVFGVDDGEPRGMVTLRATEFASRREVSTSSWLGLAHHRRGYGTQARVALLTLAFDHLGAACATTEVFPDNAASQGVSRALGYEHDGISRDVREGEVLVSDRLRLWRTTWDEPDRRATRPAVQVLGLQPCRELFGLADPS